jgi:hypothetical protein
MRACHSVARAFGRGLKQPSGLFSLAPFIRFLACGQVKRGAPALAVGLAFPPAPPARSRVASSGVFRQGLRKRVPRPCLSPPRSPSPRASASARRVGFALPLGSNRLRGSLRLCTASASPHAGPPLASPFSASAPGRGALARLPCGSAGSGGLRSSPPALKKYARAYISKLAEKLGFFSTTPRPPFLAGAQWAYCHNGNRGHHSGISAQGSHSILRSVFRQTQPRLKFRSGHFAHSKKIPCCSYSILILDIWSHLCYYDRAVVLIALIPQP